MNNFDIREEATDFGKCWYISDLKKSFRFALYTYDDDPDTVYLSNVFVDEKYRRTGLGNIILEMATDIAKKMEFKTIILKVLKTSFVHEWYERHGYRDFVADSEDISYVWMKKEL